MLARYIYRQRRCIFLIFEDQFIDSSSVFNLLPNSYSTFSTGLPWKDFEKCSLLFYDLLL